MQPNCIHSVLPHFIRAFVWKSIHLRIPVNSFKIPVIIYDSRPVDLYLAMHAVLLHANIVSVWCMCALHVFVRQVTYILIHAQQRYSHWPRHRTQDCIATRYKIQMGGKTLDELTCVWHFWMHTDSHAQWLTKANPSSIHCLPTTPISSLTMRCADHFWLHLNASEIIISIDRVLSTDDNLRSLDCNTAFS